MCVKTAKLRGSLSLLSLFLAAFGVCSVSSEAYSYPATIDSDTVHFTRSARDTPKTKKDATQPSPKSSEPPKSPFSPGSQNLSLGIGEVFLLGDKGNYYDNAIGPELHYDYGVSDLFAFESNFGYASHSRGVTSDNIWNLDAGLRANLAYFDQLVPYMNIDLGFYHPSYTYDTGGSASATLFGLQLGVGMDLLITNSVFFGAALTYNDMFDSTKTDSKGVERGLGGAYVSFMIHVGYTF